MKLYKGDKIMQMVDKDQVDICLDAGWSRKPPEEEEEEARKVQELKEAKELAAKEAKEAKEAQLLADKKAASPPKKKIVKISGSK